MTNIWNPSKVFLVGDTELRFSIAQSANRLAFRHGKRQVWNVAFVDGHVESIAKEDALKFSPGGPAALGWAQYVEWGGIHKAPNSSR